MALMIPAFVPDVGVSRAEQAMFGILRDGLDDSFTVFHSFKTVTHNRRAQLLDSEIDFLLFSRERGFLIVEVKGGPVTYDGARARWYQDEKPIRDPFDQARANKYKLGDFIRERLGRSMPVSLAHAVCFPNSYAEPSVLPPEASREILINGRDLDDVAAAIGRVYDASKPFDRALSDKEVEALHQAIMPYCEYGVALVERIEQAERKIFTLTEEQCRLLDFIRNRRAALIQGCAGSGKTVMAIKKAQELAAAGNKVLLLAFNQLIGERLKESVQDSILVKASTYHDFCLEMLEKAGAVPGGGRDDHFYTRLVPQAFEMLASQGVEQYDAIIVDEGQDFRRDYWTSLGHMLQDGGYYYIFYDPDQNVFGTEMEFPIKDEPFVLTDNCRNTRSICEYVGRYTDSDIRPMPGAPAGGPVLQHVNSSATGRRRHLAAILEKLIAEDRMDPRRVVVLGGHGIEKTCIPVDGQLGRFRVVQGDENGPQVVHYYTYMKYKGCEADAVILLDVDPSDDRWSDLAIYTTASRAKFLLFVLRVA
ncbi:MAG: NERD domain-containing protein [Dehalococcoidia bacterium]|nr:NERD domain-containing protein [Dehalococcoidia bacterium]